MVFTGLLTAGVALGVYLHALKTGGTEIARTQAFAVLVFAELLRSFGARSTTKPVWSIPLTSNLLLFAVVTVSFLLQVWSHHNETLGRLLKTTMLSLPDCFMLLAIGSIPLAVLDGLKLVQNPVKKLKEALMRGRKNAHSC